MINITHKSTTLRKAIAQAIVKVSSEDTIAAILEKKVPKGDVFEMAKTAGLFAAKRTSDMIPDCHPLPIEFTGIRYEVSGLAIRVEVEIHTIYKTGVEVEAMHTASVVALTMYDMLKPIDKGIEIREIKLLDKQGGKSDYKDQFVKPLKAAVWLCSEPVLAGKKADMAGQNILAKLKSLGIEIEEYLQVKAVQEEMEKQVRTWVKNKVDIIIISGGTGLTKKDLTPEIIRPMLDKEIPGIEAAIRNYGLARTPHAMISRTLAGLIGNSLVLVLPGSSRGAEESMDAVFPWVLHIFKGFAE